jgi:hypothetical protein
MVQAPFARGWRSPYDFGFDGSAVHAFGLASENTGFLDDCDGGQRHASPQHVTYSSCRGHREGTGIEEPPDSLGCPSIDQIVLEGLETGKVGLHE